MPRQVDHEGRRVQIAGAVFRLAGEQGLEGVTLRDVATRAGVSMGAVQRCFRTKEEMLVFALGQLSTRVTARITAMDSGSTAGPARDALGHTLTEVALVGAEHRAEARVWLAFLAQAAVTPALAEVLRNNYAELQPLLVRLIRQAGGANSAAAARREAHALLALADGLTAHTLIGHLSPTQALDLLHSQLDRLCTDAPEG